MAVHQAEEYANSRGFADGSRDSGDRSVGVVLDIHTLIIDEVFMLCNWYIPETCTQLRFQPGLAAAYYLRDTIKRLQAYQEAGADVLYAPGLTSRDDIAAVVSSVDRPVNVVMGLQGVQLSLAELSAIGVKRVSVGSALSRAALGAFLRAAREMREHGTFAFADEAVSFRNVSAMFT
jgi:hypothetical protein